MLPRLHRCFTAAAPTKTLHGQITERHRSIMGVTMHIVIRYILHVLRGCDTHQMHAWRMLAAGRMLVGCMRVQDNLLHNCANAFMFVALLAAGGVTFNYNVLFRYTDENITRQSPLNSIVLRLTPQSPFIQSFAATTKRYNKFVEKYRCALTQEEHKYLNAPSLSQGHRYLVPCPPTEPSNHILPQI